MTEKQAKKIFEKYNPADDVIRCPYGRAKMRKLLDLYAKAAVNLYGIIRRDEFVDIFNAYNEEQTSVEEIYTILLPNVLKDRWYGFYKEYLVHYLVLDDFEMVEYLEYEQENKPRYIPPQNDFLLYEWEEFEDNDHWKNVRKFMFDNFGYRSLSKAFYEIKNYVIQSYRINNVGAILDKHSLLFADEKQVRTFFDLLILAKNNTRIWENKGYTPKELGAHKIYQQKREPVVQKTDKVGRNEPCPCGSGKKYKKCCGFHATAKKEEEKTDNSEPTLEQWDELFKIAELIKQIAPWEYLCSDDPISIVLPDYDEPVFCSVLGMNGDCYGIAVYPGYEAFLGYLQLLEQPEDEPYSIAGLAQRYLICNFGNRDETTPKDREVYQKLGLKFRGNNQWISFRTADPGFYPWYINSSDADILIKTLQNLIMLCKHYANGAIKVDFEGGETLFRYYSPEDELWINEATRLPPIPVETEYLIITDELLIERLKRLTKRKQQLEFDISPFPAPIRENKSDRPYFPPFILLVDRATGIILDQQLVGKDDVVDGPVIDMIVKHIESRGSPEAIYVRDDRTGRYIKDLCDKLGIKLHQKKGVPQVDAALNDLFDHMR